MNDHWTLCGWDCLALVSSDVDHVEDVAIISGDLCILPIIVIDAHYLSHVWVCSLLIS